MSHTADINGLQLFYRDHGNGTPLLLLHGFTGTGDDWQHVFAAPLDGYRVITPDLRGHGRSTNPSGVFRFADVARDPSTNARDALSNVEGRGSERGESEGRSLSVKN